MSAEQELLGADVQKMANVAAFVDEPWGWQADTTFGERFAAGCPVAGMTPADYQVRALPVARGWLLCGIRFRGGDLAWPFVEVLADHDPLDLDEARRVVRASFQGFAPGHLRAWQLSAPGARLADAPDAYVDAAVWAARVADLQARARPAGCAALHVAPVADDGWLARVEAAYAAFHAVRPGLAQDVSIEPPETLNAAREAGLLLEARAADGAWLGLVGAMPDAWLGLDGWLVVEEILVPTAWGRGLGPALQRHLIDRLPRPDGILFGSIHGANQASWRTAAACGRAPVTAAWFIPL
jgi:hypothetical protein